MNQYLDDRNYLNDSRVATRAPCTILYLENGEEVQLPTKWEVCTVCNGEGKHVNPSIDSNGLSAEDFAEDPDFAEDYKNGTYDVPCYCCHGRTTIKVVNLDALTKEQRQAYMNQCREAEEYDAMCRAERAMGA